MIIDHIGVVVKSMDDGIDYWINMFGYEQLTEPVINTRQKVKVVFLKKTGSTTIKLVAPVDEKSPVYRFSQRGGGLHHLCFKCGDLHSQCDTLKQKGLRMLVPPQPGEAFENEDIAFMFGKFGLNIELIDTDKRKSIIPPL